MVDGAEAAALQRAATQCGVIRRDQALVAGLTARQIERRLDSGRWAVMFPGVYRVEGAPTGFRQTLHAAALWAARDYAFSHRTAATLWGFGRYPEGPVELVLARHGRPPPGLVVHRVPELSFHDVRLVDGLRVTTRTRTLVDLAGDEAGEDLRATVDEALNRRWVSLDQLEAELEKRSHRRGLAVVRALVRRYRGGDGPSESELEARVLELLEGAGVQHVERQRRLVVGGRLRRLDFRLRGTPTSTASRRTARGATR